MLVMTVIITTFLGLFKRVVNIFAPEEEAMNDESTNLEDSQPMN